MSADQIDRLFTFFHWFFFWLLMAVVAWGLFLVVRSIATGTPLYLCNPPQSSGESFFYRPNSVSSEAVKETAADFPNRLLVQDFSLIGVEAQRPQLAGQQSPLGSTQGRLDAANLGAEKIDDAGGEVRQDNHLSITVVSRPQVGLALLPEHPMSREGVIAGQDDEGAGQKVGNVHLAILRNQPARAAEIIHTIPQSEVTRILKEGVSLHKEEK